MRKALLAIFVLALLGGGYAYKKYTEGQTDITTVATDLTVTAPELLAQYAADEAKANEKYLNKVIEVKGSIAEAPKADEKGIVSIMLQGDDTGGVNCELSEIASKDPINTYEVGQQLIIKGKCSGSNGIDVVLSQCAVVK